MKTCPNCGLQVEPKPQGLADVSVEQIVAADDSIRLHQLRNPDAPHSINLAAGAPRHEH